MKRKLVWMLVFWFLSAGVSHGQIILVDFDNTATNPSQGGTWNTIPTPTGSTALFSSSGAATGVAISFSGGWSDGVTDQGSWPAGNVSWVDALATNDFFLFTGISATSQTITFSNLTPGVNYRVDWVSARSSSPFSAVGDYSIFGNFANSTPNGDDFNSIINGWTNGSILRWDSVTPNGSNQIVLTASIPAGFQFAYTNAVRLEAIAVPEPSTLLIASGSMLAFAGYCYHRHRQLRRQMEAQA
jgi:hypothetical protein